MPATSLPSPLPSRRDFLRTAALTMSGAALALEVAAAPGSSASRPIIAFSKPFQSLGAEETAALVAEVGWNGIECPVRKGGQIEPERAGEELPRFVDAFRRQGLEIALLVTDINSIGQPHAETVLRTAAKLGIKRLRLGQWKYAANRPLLAQLNEIGARLQEIGAACKELGLQAGVENHSGADLFAAPIWDAFTALREHRADHVGFCFDIGHATIEGGLSWPIQVRLVEPFYTAVYVKDFTWIKGAKGWRPTWCPLGEGMVDRSYVARLQQSGYAGPLCQHHEYPLGDKAEMMDHFRRDLRVLRDWLA